MGMRLEWISSTDAVCSPLRDGDEAADGQLVDEGGAIEVFGPGNSGGFIITGTPDELTDFHRKFRAAIMDLRSELEKRP